MTTPEPNDDTVWNDLAERVRRFVGGRTGYWMCRNQTAALIEMVDDVVARDLRDDLAAAEARVDAWKQMAHDNGIAAEAAQAALAEMRGALTAIAKADVVQSDGVMLRKMAAAAIFNDAALRSPEAPSEPEARAQGEG